MNEILILFENEGFVAVDKPVNVLTVPSRFEKEDNRPVLGRILEKKLSCQLYPLHRLDLEVSGLVLFAKTSSAQRLASGWFEKRLVKKTYQALSQARSFDHWPVNLRKADHDIPVGSEVEWKCLLMRGKRRAYEHPKGDVSLTTALRLGSEGGPFEKWTLHPLTGRSHQLRFEMSRHGFPILGDQLYGSKASYEGIALRAISIDFSGVIEESRAGLPNHLELKGLF